MKSMVGVLVSVCGGLALGQGCSKDVTPTTPTTLSIANNSNNNNQQGVVIVLPVTPPGQPPSTGTPTAPTVPGTAITTPEELLDIVRSVFTNAGSPIGEQAESEVYGCLLNQIAWLANGNNSSGRWGLNTKSEGNNGSSPQGVPVAVDIIHDRVSNTLYDVFRGTTNPDDVPQVIDVGFPEAGREWLAPIPSFC